MRVEIGIATSGRPSILGIMLDNLLNQTRLPDRIIICAARPHEDVDHRHIRSISHLVPIAVLQGSKGASSQRNTIIENAETAGILLFFDDDFFPAATFIDRLHELFSARPDIVVATGLVLADGAPGSGIEPRVALATLKAIPSSTDQDQHITPVYNGYGCNMAVRADTVRGHSVRFDEALPLYSWLEDVDFSRQLSGHGQIVRAHSLLGVHLGTKRGRVSGLRFGYAQIANPIYLARKGTMLWRLALRQMLRNVLRNAVGAVVPEPWVDRRGRLAGNGKALYHLLTGDLRPGNIVNMT